MRVISEITGADVSDALASYKVDIIDNRGKSFAVVATLVSGTSFLLTEHSLGAAREIQRIDRADRHLPP